jgi:hypothetical protein
MSTGRGQRKRKASTRLVNSDEALAKKLRHINTTESRLAPVIPSTAGSISRQPSASSLQSSHTTPPPSPSPTVEDSLNESESTAQDAAIVPDESDDGPAELDPQAKLGTDLHASTLNGVDIKDNRQTL